MYVRCTVRPWMFWTCIKNNFAAAASQHWSPPTKPRRFQQQLFTQKIYFAYPVQIVNSKVVFAQFIDKTSHQAAMEIRPLAAVQRKQSAELESKGVMPAINSEEGPEERHRYSDRLLPDVTCLQSFYMAQGYQKNLSSTYWPLFHHSGLSLVFLSDISPIIALSCY